MQINVSQQDEHVTATLASWIYPSMPLIFRLIYMYILQTDRKHRVFILDEITSSLIVF